MKGIYETVIDKMGNHTLSDKQRAELALFHSHQPNAKSSEHQDGLSELQMPWIHRPLPGIRTHY